jgi:hypothetical protein
MASILFATIIGGLVLAIRVLIEFCFSFFQILFKKPLSPKGAVEIDTNEHIYAHPDYTDQLQDHRSFGVQTTHEAFLHGLKIAGNRPLFSFRQSSDQSFKSYSYK